ncbi:MAG: NAD(P)/FAD-dependent oxidoreductase [Bacteroidetes bacterium]|nr:MAG: NAD(P)/FAD-dependent oxidoreductase [Bacteroidota bacterium]
MDTYDVVIIGSGLGGLLCGYILSKEGMRVCVLEKNRQIGGSLQTFVRDKCIFDTGIHYIGGLAEGQNLYRYFSYFGLMDKLKLKRMDMNRFDVVGFDGDEQEYEFAQEYPNFIERLCRRFPREREAITEYARKIHQITTRFPLYHLEPESGTLMEEESLRIGTRDYLAALTSNVKLQNVLAGSNMLYAGEGDKTPLYVHALINNTYIESSWKCVDGGSQIARLLARSIRAQGGKILRYKEAVKLRADHGQLCAVETADGDYIAGKYFISNIHPERTLELLNGCKYIRKAYRTRISSLENTISIFSLHLVFKPGTFPYLNYNYYHHKYPDVWRLPHYDKQDWPIGYALFVPASSKSDEYAEGMNVMAYMRYEEVEKWAHTQNIVSKEADRGEDYEAFKTYYAERMLDELEKKFPGIRQCIKSYYTSTPLSYRDYIGTVDGNMYGIKKDYKAPFKSFIKTRTRVPNLLFTGQNLHMHGVLGVTVGAVITCSELLGHLYLIDKIRRAS